MLYLLGQELCAGRGRLEEQPLRTHAAHDGRLTQLRLLLLLLVHLLRNRNGLSEQRQGAPVDTRCLIDGRAPEELLRGRVVDAVHGPEHRGVVVLWPAERACARVPARRPGPQGRRRRVAALGVVRGRCRQRRRRGRGRAVHVAELVEDGGQALLGHGGGVVAALELVEVEVGRVKGRRHCAALESRVAGGSWPRRPVLFPCFIEGQGRRREGGSLSIVMLIYCRGWRGFSEYTHCMATDKIYKTTSNLFFSLF